ncbi:MAG TPA: ClpXP protease specificity-enhancing factor [Rhodocyclaceae bacterium]
MLSTKPYLLRAIYEWCVDQGFTPYLQVAVDARTRVPREHVRDGQIVLNVSPEATSQLLIGNDEISFQARFNGSAFPILIPVDTVAAIYARENGQGMAFEVIPAGEGEALAEDEDVAPPFSAKPDVEPDEPPPAGGGRSHLKVVK